MTEDGILIIKARCYRTQGQNRLDAISRLTTLVQQALSPKSGTKPSQPNLQRGAREPEETVRGHQMLTEIQA
jgi:ribosome-associated protein